jgi:hypothetical protein
MGYDACIILDENLKRREIGRPSRGCDGRTGVVKEVEYQNVDSLGA